ncbi:MAG: hypothetical protein ACXWKR_06705 [Phenylobacterium sp.]
MRHLLALAAGVSLVATAAHAQIDPVTGRPYGVVTPGARAAPRQPDFTRPLPVVGSTKPLPGFGPQSVTPPHLGSYGLPREPAIATTHPFSPEGEAARERRANAMPKGGPFSPEGEARRERAAEKRANAAASPF